MHWTQTQPYHTHTHTHALTPHADRHIDITSDGRARTRAFRQIKTSTPPRITPSHFCQLDAPSERQRPRRTTPHRTAPHLTAPHRTAPHRTSPHRIAPHHTAPHRDAIQPCPAPPRPAPRFATPACPNTRKGASEQTSVRTSTHRNAPQTHQASE